MSSLFTLFGILAALLIGGASAAHATTPPSNCVNGQYGLVNAVICEIDADDNGVLNDNDFKVIIPGEVLSDNDIDVLTDALDNLTVNAPITVGDITVIKGLIVNIFPYINPVVIIVLPCGC